jgi:hypothetical protein
MDPDIPAAILDGQVLGTAGIIKILDGAFNRPVDGFRCRHLGHRDFLPGVMAPIERPPRRVGFRSYTLR